MASKHSHLSCMRELLAHCGKGVIFSCKVEEMHRLVLDLCMDKYLLHLPDTFQQPRQEVQDPLHPP